MAKYSLANRSIPKWKILLYEGENETSKNGAVEMPLPIYSNVPSLVRRGRLRPQQQKLKALVKDGGV